MIGGRLELNGLVFLDDIPANIQSVTFLLFSNISDKHWR